MRLAVKHITYYAYGSPLDYTIQRLLMTPPAFATQRPVTWTVTAPGIESALQFKDCFGNHVHLLTSLGLRAPHTVVAEGLVDVEDAAGVVRGLPELVSEHVYLRQTPATLPSPAMMDLLESISVPRADRLQFLHALMNAIHQAISYVPGTTDAYTSAASAFAQGRGVCQDHAHVMLGLARAAQIPSRYVTGYLMADGVSPAAHAWAELLVPDLGWVGFDAANAKCPTDHYVRVAAGLDAAGTAPIRGCRRGGSTEQMTVEVSVEVAQQ